MMATNKPRCHNCKYWGGHGLKSGVGPCNHALRDWRDKLGKKIKFIRKKNWMCDYWERNVNDEDNNQK